VKRLWWQDIRFWITVGIAELILMAMLAPGLSTYGFHLLMKGFSTNEQPSPDCNPPVCFSSAGERVHRSPSIAIDSHH
jgi:hypothetical protein